jgi:hypothetical protein
MVTVHAVVFGLSGDVSPPSLHFIQNRWLRTEPGEERGRDLPTPFCQKMLSSLGHHKPRREAGGEHNVRSMLVSKGKKERKERVTKKKKGKEKGKRALGQGGCPS